MSKGAKQHVAEDEKRKKKIDVLNSADDLILRAEKLLKDSGDKVPDDIRSQLETRLEKLRKAYESGNIDAIKSAIQKLNNIWKEIASGLHRPHSIETQPSPEHGNTGTAKNDSEKKGKGGGKYSRESLESKIRWRSSCAKPASKLEIAIRAHRKKADTQEYPDLYSEVHLGVSTPKTVNPKNEFIARFAVYTDRFRHVVNKIFKKESPAADPRLDMETCRWRKGAKVSVHLEASNTEVINPNQEFEWNEKYHILRFDVKPLAELNTDSLILKFDIAVQGLPVVHLRPEIIIENEQNKKLEPQEFLEKTAPNSAFASYASNDRSEVLGRVRSLQIFTGIDVYLDCLSIRPGQKWKASIENEIKKRDIFWLFWSHHAMASKWVEWEWRTALKDKSISGIQPHPLEPAEIAPPPEELSDLQFGSMYEWYISHLRGTN